MDLGPWGLLTILAGIMGLSFAACVFVYVKRLDDRRPAPLGEEIGAHKAILVKLRKAEPMSQEELDYATELVSDARSPLALAIPATLFCTGFFYVVGCLYELHLYGGDPSFRTFIGGIPMLTSINIAVQLRKVARLKKKLAKVTVTTPEVAEMADTSEDSEQRASV